MSMLNTQIPLLIGLNSEGLKGIKCPNDSISRGHGCHALK